MTDTVNCKLILKHNKQIRLFLVIGKSILLNKAIILYSYWNKIYNINLNITKNSFFISIFSSSLLLFILFKALLIPIILEGLFIIVAEASREFCPLLLYSFKVLSIIEYICLAFCSLTFLLNLSFILCLLAIFWFSLLLFSPLLLTLLDWA